MLKLVTGERKTNSKIKTLHPFHSKSPTSTPTLYTPLENLSHKITKSRTRLKIFKRRTTKESRNNYLHYRYL
jgi:hypothetical protein